MEIFFTASFLEKRGHKVTAAVRTGNSAFVLSAFSAWCEQLEFDPRV
jgi:hypothetical protein